MQNGVQSCIFAFLRDSMWKIMHTSGVVVVYSLCRVPLCAPKMVAMRRKVSSCTYENGYQVTPMLVGIRFETWNSMNE